MCKILLVRKNKVWWTYFGGHRLVHQGGTHIYTGVCVLKFSEHLFK